jgi:hypothetical protein
VRNWRVDTAAVSWEFENKRPGKYVASLGIRAKEEQSKDMSLVLFLDNKKVAEKGLDNMKMNKWSTIDFGTLKLSKGIHSIRVRRLSAGRRKNKKAKQRIWGEVMIGELSLTPVSK